MRDLDTSELVFVYGAGSSPTPPKHKKCKGWNNGSKSKGSKSKGSKGKGSKCKGSRSKGYRSHGC